MVIVKYGNLEQIDEIISSFSKGKGIQLKMRMPTIQKPQPKQQAEEPIVKERQDQAVNERIGSLQKKQQIKPAAPKAEYGEEPELPKRPGVKGWLKDSLGIIDVNKPKPDKKKKQ